MVQMIGSLIAGVLLFNAVPHLVQGICGKRHMSPLARESSAAVNVVWAWINLVVGALMARASHCGTWGTAEWAAFVIGGFGVSIYLAIFWSNPDARLPWQRK